MKNHVLAAILCSTLIAVSCKKEKISSAEETVAYVAGNETVAGIETSTIWKNGEVIAQASSATHSYARAVAVDGNDVYSTGYENDGVWKWKVWKNGNSLYTFFDGEPTDGAAIAVSGGNVYTAGHYYSPGTSRHYAVVAKNDEGLQMLTDGMQQAEAHGIAVSGNDVYVAGYYGTESRLWKNGVMETLNNASGYRANAVTIKGSDVYVLGYSYSLPIKTRFWKNGVATDIESGTGDAFGKSIAVSDNGDVYIAGYELINGKATARLWKNGTGSTLNDGTKHAFANAVAVKGNDVYVAGFERDANNILQYAKIWKNGVQISLSTKKSEALGIFLK